MSEQTDKRFSELEYCLEKYFRYNLVPVMNQAQKELQDKQYEELAEYTASPLYALSASNPFAAPLDPVRQLKQSGEWNSKTAEDYIGICLDKIVGDTSIQKDLVTFTQHWRETFQSEIGKERYDELSFKLGSDVAQAYVDHRIHQMMINRLIDAKTPKDTADFIMKKAASTTLFGTIDSLNQSHLDSAILAKAEKQYNPSKMEETAAWALGSASDAILLGGLNWKSIATAVGIDAAATALFDSSGEPDKINVDQCLSQAIFGPVNSFDMFRGMAREIENPKDMPFISSFDAELSNKIIYEEYKPMSFENKAQSFFEQKNVKRDNQEVGRDYSEIPSIIAPGKEEEYLEEKKLKQSAESTQSTEQAQSSMQTSYSVQSATTTEQTVQEAPATTNTNGWGNLMGSLGLDGLDKIGNNLGYIISMLPDVLFGLFTGKSSSLLTKNSLLPLASIIGGLFVRNPLLKTMMIGLGGLNLFNKAGKDAEILAHGDQLASASTFKKYKDEPLDPRVSNVQLKGNTLIADIDKVPVTIQLNEKVVKAHEEGALPLNTLVNAVIRKNDQAIAMIQENYTHAQQETIVRPRGIQ